MSFLQRIANGLGTLLGVLVEATVTVIQGIKQGFEDYQRRTGLSSSDVRTQAQRDRERLRVVNEEIIYLRNRHRSSGGLSERERRRWHDLKEERDALNQELGRAKEVQAAEKIIDNESVIEKVEIDLNTTHVLQYNAFADSLNKRCRVCGRPMKLQWRRDLAIAGPRDFFWGCTGWYLPGTNDGHACKFQEKLARNDFGLMTDISEPEFELSAEEFGIIVDDPGTSSIIAERVSDLQSDLKKKKHGVELVTCPVHGENMVLRNKSGASGLLDSYFLACPHWRPHDDNSCPFMEKLKSGAQLAALLKSQTGRGVL
ncbi:hypothetical protein U5817_17295 [Aromatoleum evansii]|uniref:Uncharacterized protein n=1 Tax=Aromatoleum evansii TaxID=59406 RepID=A0ABZ1AGG0_AROEV|nr:hypothetical protein U5817_17295 [Aromatoleum evansii]